MVEWFKDLSEAWQTTIFGAGVAITIAVIGRLSGLFKWLHGLFTKKDAIATQQDIHQSSSGNTAVNIDGSRNIVTGGSVNVNSGISEDVLKAALEALNTALSLIDTDKSKNLVSELKHISDERQSIPIELEQDKLKNGQKLQLEKEFQLYGELWKAIVDVRSSIIITPTLDIMPKGKSPCDVYKDRYDVAVNAFNKASQLLEYHRPFFHDDVCTIADEFLGKCRCYIRSVARMLKSENFDEDLHDKADALLEIIPKAIDEIEKAIKRRIGLLPKTKNNDNVSSSPEPRFFKEITKGSIIYRSNTVNLKPLIDLKMSIVGGYIKRNDFGKIEAYIRTDMPFQPLQRLNEKLGLDSMRLLSESDTISVDTDNLTVFKSSTSHILPEREMVLDLSTWQEVPFPMTIHVQTQTKVSGHLTGKVFQGKFKAIITYQELDSQIGIDGDCQVHLV